MTDRLPDRVAGNRAELRQLMRLLRRLIKGARKLSLNGADIIRLEGDDHAYCAALVRRAVAQGIIRQSEGALLPTAATAAFMRRAMMPDDALADPYAGQHRIASVETMEIDRRRRPVLRNLAESPLLLLGRLKDREGRPFLPAEALDAGERLAADFTRAQLQPRVTASWEPRLSKRTRGEAGGQAAMTDSAIAARERFGRAMDAMGPELSGVAVDVCCFCKGLETVERERQWPVRSAKLMLRTALLALSRHYAPPPRGSARGSHHWGAADYRPVMS